MPLEESRRYIESLDNVEAAWVMKDGASNTPADLRIT
jgi:hypothetical protein